MGEDVRGGVVWVGCKGKGRMGGGVRRYRLHI